MLRGSNHLVGIFQSIRIARFVFQRFTRHFKKYSCQNSLNPRFGNSFVIAKCINIQYQFFRLLHILYNLFVNIRQWRFRQIVIIGRHCRSKFQRYFTKERGQQIIVISSQEKCLSLCCFHHISIQFFTFNTIQQKIGSVHSFIQHFPETSDIQISGIHYACTDISVIKIISIKRLVTQYK